MRTMLSKREKRRLRRKYEAFGRSILDLAAGTEMGLSQETIMREAARKGIGVHHDSRPPSNHGGYDAR